MLLGYSSPRTATVLANISLFNVSIPCTCKRSLRAFVCLVRVAKWVLKTSEWGFQCYCDQAGSASWSHLSDHPGGRCGLENASLHDWMGKTKQKSPWSLMAGPEDDELFLLPNTSFWLISVLPRIKHQFYHGFQQRNFPVYRNFINPC